MADRRLVGLLLVAALAVGCSGDDGGGDGIRQPRGSRRENSQRGNATVRRDTEQRVGSRIRNRARARLCENAIRVGVEHVTVRVRRCLVRHEVGNHAPLSTRRDLDDGPEGRAPLAEGGPDSRRFSEADRDECAANTLKRHIVRPDG